MNNDRSPPPKKGRGYPPAEHQWRPGTSGNPRGRPRGSKNREVGALTASEQIALEEARRIVATSDGEIETVRAVNRAQAVGAMKGGVMAQRNFVDRIARIEEKLGLAKRQELEDAEAYKRWFDQFRLLRPDVDIARLDPLPHPDDVEVNFQTGVVRIRGPANTFEREHFQIALATLNQIRRGVLACRRRLVKAPHDRGLFSLLLRYTTSFVEKNEQLPERYKLPPLPKWRNRPDLPSILESLD